MAISERKCCLLWYFWLRHRNNDTGQNEGQETHEWCWTKTRLEICSARCLTSPWCLLFTTLFFKWLLFYTLIAVLIVSWSDIVMNTYSAAAQSAGYEPQRERVHMRKIASSRVMRQRFCDQGLCQAERVRGKMIKQHTQTQRSLQQCRRPPQRALAVASRAMAASSSTNYGEDVQQWWK